MEFLANIVLSLIHLKVLKCFERSKKKEEDSSHKDKSEDFALVSLKTDTYLADGKPEAKESHNVWLYFVAISFLSVMAMGLSSSSLRFLSFPTKVIIKSSKVVIIMVVGLFVIHKKYSLSDYGLALATVVGLACFTLGDASSAHSEDSGFGWKTAKGFASLSCSLLFESMMVNLQKKLLSKTNTSPVEMLFHTSLCGSVFLFVITTVITNEFSQALVYLAENPHSQVYVAMFVLFGYGGMVCVLQLLHNFDPMVVGLVVTSRKTLTVLISFCFFPKPFTSQHFFGTILVFVPLFIHVYRSAVKR